MVLYNVPEHHVNHKHHQSDNKAQGGTEGHENGGNSGSGTGTEQAENKGEKGKEAGNRVENHGISEIVQDCLIDVDVGSTVYDKIISNRFAWTATPLDTFSKDTENGLGRSRCSS